MYSSLSLSDFQNPRVLSRALCEGENTRRRGGSGEETDQELDPVWAGNGEVIQHGELYRTRAAGSEGEFGGEPSHPDCRQGRSPGPILECGRLAPLIRLLQYPFSRCSFGISGMAARGLKIWAAAEDFASNRGYVLSLYRQLLRSLNSPSLPLNLAARLAKKAEVRAIFLLGSEERSVHNIKDLTDTAEYALGVLRKGEIPKYIQ
ncbi:unnamed protein product [Linum tenue]|uniref:LYR motif containing domain-containing protein n=1 Tax=Linum tenue TaxID=586396 RepID=A0AAV0NC73_9ROSI|nr:unnamed protein product [Linum tenue]